MKVTLAIGTVFLALLWTGFIGLSAALANWVAGQGVDLQGGLQTIAQWPLPPWIALWTDAGTAEAVRASIVWSVEMLAAVMPWITPLLDWVGNPPDKPKSREVEFSKKEVLREEVEIY